MASIDCVIDTNPMANELSSVSRHVGGTTTAVVAMKAAVIKAEADAANHLVTNVNRGFFSLIHSQISQKVAKAQAEVESILMQLNQQRKSLNRIHDELEHDYNMLCARYGKIFNSLNRALRERIAAIDRPVMDFVCKDMDRVSRRPAALTATVPVMQSEALAASETLKASEVKHRCVVAIETIDRFLSGVKQQDELTARVLLRRSTPQPISYLMEPTIIFEANYDAGPQVASVHAGPWIPSRGKEQILQAQSQMKWSAPKTANQQLAGDFHRMVAASHKSERVKQMATALFAKASYSTL